MLKQKKLLEGGSVLQRVHNLEKRINKLEALIEHASTVRKTSEEILLTAHKDLKELKKKEEEYNTAAAALQVASNKAREEVCKHLEDLVNSALRHVYGEDFKFTIELSIDKRGRPRAETYVESNGVKNKPIGFRGGGVVDVISIALRLGIAALIQDTPPSGPLLLDEPGGNLDRESAEQLGEFLYALAKNSNRQIIVVTHHDTIAAYADPGGAFKVTQEKGISSVTNEAL